MHRGFVEGHGFSRAVSEKLTAALAAGDSRGAPLLAVFEKWPPSSTPLTNVASLEKHENEHHLML